MYVAGAAIWKVKSVTVVGVARGRSIQYNSQPVYMTDKRIYVREGWKYLKFDLQVPIFAVEEEWG